MNIYQKMSAITQEISTVAKNLQVGEGKNQYKAVGEADVLAAVKPIEAKHGVYSFPFSRDIVESGEMIATTKYGERKSLYLRVKTVYRFVNTDDPKEYIDITTYGDGVDTQDKAPGKAMTYGDKYALLKAYKIQTGDDPDQNESEMLDNVNRKEIDRTGEPAYPPIGEMIVNIKDYVDKHPNVSSFIDQSMQQVGASNLNELAAKKPTFIQAVWNKWCNK